MAPGAGEGERVSPRVAKTGKILFGVGLGLAALGGVAAAIAASNADSRTYVGASAERIFGVSAAVSLVSGGVCVLVGIPLWIAGSN